MWPTSSIKSQKSHAKLPRAATSQAGTSMCGGRLRRERTSSSPKTLAKRPALPPRLAMAPPVASQQTRCRTSAVASAPPEAEERPAASSAAVLLSQVAPVTAGILGVAHCPLS
jgi:hypothetical protein